MSILKRHKGIKMAEMKELKAKAKALEPIVRIGKSGMSESVAGEIKKHLKEKQIIKVKMLRSFVGANDKKALADEIAEKTDSLLVQRVGFVVVLARK